MRKRGVGWSARAFLPPAWLEHSPLSAPSQMAECVLVSWTARQGAEVDLVDDGWTDIIRNLQQLLAKATREMREAGASREEISKMRQRVQVRRSSTSTSTTTRRTTTTSSYCARANNLRCLC